MALARNIRYLRKKKEWSQDLLAEKLGYKSYTTIQKWEMGISEPPLKILKKLAELFNVDMNDLANKDLSLPTWQPTITEKDEKDIKKKLDALLNQLTNDTGLMYDGEPMDQESQNAVRVALEVAERTAILEARRKFTPDKFKK